MSLVRKALEDNVAEYGELVPLVHRVEVRDGLEIGFQDQVVGDYRMVVRSSVDFTKSPPLRVLVATTTRDTFSDEAVLEGELALVVDGAQRTVDRVERIRGEGGELAGWRLTVEGS